MDNNSDDDLSGDYLRRLEMFMIAYGRGEELRKLKEETSKLDFTSDSIEILAEVYTEDIVKELGSLNSKDSIFGKSEEAALQFCSKIKVRPAERIAIKSYLIEYISKIFALNNTINEFNEPCLRLKNRWIQFRIAAAAAAGSKDLSDSDAKKLAKKFFESQDQLHQFISDFQNQAPEKMAVMVDKKV
jgi:hypothetical protein